MPTSVWSLGCDGFFVSTASHCPLPSFPLTCFVDLRPCMGGTCKLDFKALFPKHYIVIRTVLAWVVHYFLFVVAYCVLLPDSMDWNGVEDDEEWGNRVLNRAWFALATSSTIGYGDITPRTRRAKALAATQILTMLGLFVLLRQVRADDSQPQAPARVHRCLHGR